MKSWRPGIREDKRERAVSELIGAILLISLVVLAMAIITVIVLSQPPPEEVPHLNALASMNETTGQVFLYHNGGDGLKEEDAIILINNDPTQNSGIQIRSEDGTIANWAGSNIPWTVGKTLIISSATTPTSVSLIFRGSSSQSLILTTTFTPDD